MKKLMIGAAIVCAAVASQASSFTWKTANYQQFVDPTSKAAVTTAEGYTSAMNGGNIVLVYLADGTYSTAQLLSKYDTGYSEGATAGYKTGNPATTKYGIAGTYMTDGTETNLKDGDKLGVMYVDAKGALSQLIYADSGNKFEDVYTISGLDSANPKDGWAGATFTIGTAGTSAARTNFTIQSVPEPTSGLLLLLGIGAMALRRRRA